MSPESYRKTLDVLGLTQAKAAELFHLTDRTGRNWARYGPPTAVAICLKLVVVKAITLKQLVKLARGA